MAGPRTFHVTSFGCQMNLADAQLVRSILEADGLEPAQHESDADILLFLTCSVREHAQVRALGRVASAARARARRPGLLVGVLGCLAEELGAELFTRGADLVLGPDHYRALPALLDAHTATGRPQLAGGFTGENYADLLPLANGRVTGFVPVMRGCDNFCAYCIVPLVRGRERSRPADSIVNEVATRVCAGLREVCLVGQNVLAYHDRDVDFAELLARCAAVPGLVRLRFITAHPRDLTDRVIGALATTPAVCPHLHLPLQSGSDRVLELMNRGYTSGWYRDRVAALRRALPDIAITTDLLVGFPGETDEDFQRTLAAVEELDFSQACMYRYSPRPGTAAADRPVVPVEVAAARLARLIEVQNGITRRHHAALVGTVVRVLVEKPAPRGGGSWGRSAHDRPVVIQADLAPGTLADVRIECLRGWTPVGRPVEAVTT